MPQSATTHLAMPLLNSAIHPDVAKDKGRCFTRYATRAIVLRGEQILLLYTARYDDYTLPGGGVDEGEAIEASLERELKEETGASGVRNIVPLGIYEELRPWYKGDFDSVQMRSYCFYCDIDEQLGDTQLEDYELSNGMRPVWLSLDEAIAHNRRTLAESPKAGLSVQRELFLLELVRERLSTAA
ncbi:NUDIX hydrolase [Aliagarivorans taiwanensis]|uniref:NUDIX hydrolase n=1 Tax=Aliagarivorans taiwanensis TaxID=561966 RepID=UPI00041242DF